MSRRLGLGLAALILAFTIVPRLAAAGTCTVSVNVGGQIVKEQRNTGRFLPSCTCEGNCDLDDFIALFINVAQFFLGFAGFIATYYFISGAFTLVISSGSAERIEAGKKTLLGALVGLFIVFLAWTVINTTYFVFVGESVSPFGKKWFELKDPGKPSGMLPIMSPVASVPMAMQTYWQSIV